MFVHGRGKGSLGNKPKIKYFLQSYLNGHRQVRAYCQANEANGGEGAMFVLLSKYL